MRRTKNFSEKEFNCKCPRCNRTQPHEMDPEVMELVQEVRGIYGEPLTLTSAYRCPEHPVEAKKSKPGTHGQGLAVDIAVKSGFQAFRLIEIGIELGCTGFADGNGFVHLDFKANRVSTWRY